MQLIEGTHAVKPSADAALADRLVLAAIRLTRTLRALNKSSPLSGPLISALAVIVYSERIAAKDLAKLEELTPASISRLIAELMRRGLVKRKTDAADARLQWITATPKGARVIVEGHQRRLGPLAGAISALSDAERKELGRAVRLVERITSATSAFGHE